MDRFRNEVKQSDSALKERQLADGPKASEGYGGKFGVQKDRQDKVTIF